MDIPPEAIQIAYIIGAGVASRPVLKLIETISPAFGKAYKPIEIMLEAKAQVKADKIKALGELEIKETVENRQIEIAEKRGQRASDRIEYTEERRQANLEDVFKQVQEFLPETVSEEKVDEDWFFQFMDSAQDFSDKQMKQLWAKILAGEIAQPKSFSIRTLRVLKTLSKDEAEIFTKVSQAAMFQGKIGFILSIKKYQQLLKDIFDIDFSDVLILRELGLLQTTSLGIHLGACKDKEPTIVYTYGDTYITLEREPGASAQVVDVEFYTKTGSELLSLIEIKPNIKYVQIFATTIKKQKCKVRYGKFYYENADTINLVNVVELSKDS